MEKLELTYIKDNELYLIKEYFTYEEAKEFVNKTKPHIKTKRLYVKDMQGWAVGRLPIRPNHVYKNKGWVSWEAFFKID